MAATLHSIDGVPIFSVGTWKGDKYTAGDLDAMVESFGMDKVGFVPTLKLGHSTDKAMQGFAGSPAVGVVKALRRVGNFLMADFCDIPRKVFDLIKNKAYRRVSAEVYWDHKIPHTDKTYRRVLCAVALLGGTVPAVRNIGELEALYSGDEWLAYLETEAGSKAYELEINGDGFSEGAGDGDGGDGDGDPPTLTYTGITEGGGPYIYAELSRRSWDQVDKSKLPASCFLIVGDPDLKATWKLPVYEGAGGIDPDTGMYRQRGPVNLGAVRAALAAIGGARTGKPMTVPARVKEQLQGWLEQAREAEGSGGNIVVNAPAVDRGHNGNTGDGGGNMEDKDRIAQLEKEVADLTAGAKEAEKKDAEAEGTVKTLSDEKTAAEAAAKAAGDELNKLKADRHAAETKAYVDGLCTKEKMVILPKQKAIAVALLTHAPDGDGAAKVYSEGGIDLTYTDALKRLLEGGLNLTKYIKFGEELSETEGDEDTQPTTVIGRIEKRVAELQEEAKAAGKDMGHTAAYEVIAEENPELYAEFERQRTVRQAAR